MKSEVKRFDLAQRWILEAGQKALFYYKKSLDVMVKKDGSLVTKADLEIETFLRKKIELHFPEDNIIGEEFENVSNVSSTYTWTVDPIDGTFSFANKLPLFGNLIGLIKDGKPIMGLIYCPTLNEGIFVLKDYQSIWIQNKSESDFACSFKEDFNKTILSSSGIELLKGKKIKRLYSSLLENIRYERSYGDCYGHLLVASGRIDFMFDPRLKIWDYVPLIPILESAGGKLFTLSKYSNGDISALSCHKSYTSFVKEIKKSASITPLKV